MRLIISHLLILRFTLQYSRYLYRAVVFEDPEHYKVMLIRQKSDKEEKGMRQGGECKMQMEYEKY